MKLILVFTLFNIVFGTLSKSGNKLAKSSAEYMKAYHRAYYMKNKETILAKQKEYLLKNPEKVMAIKKRYSESEQKLEISRKWRAKNKDKIDAYRRKWDQDNKEKRNQYQREYGKRVRDKLIDAKVEEQWGTGHDDWLKSGGDTSKFKFKIHEPDQSKLNLIKDEDK